MARDAEAQRLIESVFGGFDDIETQVREESREARSAGAKKRWEGRKGFVPGVDDDADYDPHQVYTRTTNVHNHSTSVKVNLPQDLSAVIGKVVGHDDTPYVSAADLARDAIVHRLMYWEATLGDDELGRLIDAQVQLAQLERQAMLRKATDDLAELLVVEMREASTRGDVEGLAKMVEGCRRQLGSGKVFGGALEKMLELVEKYG